MAFKKGGESREFKYSFRGIDRVIEERGNQFIRFAQIAWVGEDEEVEPEKIKYDIRKYTTDSDGNEKMLKGVSMFSENGVNELTNVLVEEGFGDTERIVTSLKTRTNFEDSIKSAYGITKKSDDNDNTFDIRSILG